MVDEIYNPAIDNLEKMPKRKEEPRLNPSTNISNFTREQPQQIRSQYIKPVLSRQIKAIRLSNMIKKQRLQNQIQKLKLQRKMELLARKGKLKQVLSMPIARPKLPLYPAFATPEVMNDIDSMYADTGHSDGNIFGNENYYDETFYDEDFYGNEFDTDAFTQLGIKPRNNLTPLFW